MDEIKVFDSLCSRLVCITSDVCRQVWEVFLWEKTKQIAEALHHVSMVKVVNKRVCKKCRPCHGFQKEF